MTYEIKFEINADELGQCEDGYLVSLWHIAQANPAPDDSRAAGNFVERVGREMIARFVKSAPIPLWNRQGSDFYFGQLLEARNAQIAAKIDAVTAPASAGTQVMTVNNPDNWITVPDTTLPGGLFVPSFQYARYPASRGADGTLELDVQLAPWVRVTHAEARAACAVAGVELARESQELAIRHLVAQQSANWTGGEVGAGTIYQGLHKGTVSGPQHAGHLAGLAADSVERSWHVLGAKIDTCPVYGLAGNIWTLVHDDIQGDEHGLVAGTLRADSPSLMTAPYPSMERGMGYRPDGARDWSGRALFRGGYWNVGDDAGVFALVGAHPGVAYDRVGFRCTKPNPGL